MQQVVAPHNLELQRLPPGSGAGEPQQPAREGIGPGGLSQPLLEKVQAAGNGVGEPVEGRREGRQAPFGGGMDEAGGEGEGGMNDAALGVPLHEAVHQGEINGFLRSRPEEGQQGH